MSPKIALDRAYFMGREKTAARGHAQKVKQYEREGRTGAWADWADYTAQWPYDSDERRAVVKAFISELDLLDVTAEHDTRMADIW